MAKNKQKTNILVVGPSNSGKTTFLNTLSMTPIIEVDYRPSEEICEIDFPGNVEYGAFLTPEVEVELRALPCNSPASESFDMNWEVAAENADAVMMLLPSDNPRAFLEAHRMLDMIEKRLDVPFLLALTRNDEGLVWDRADVADCFQVPEDFIVYLDPRDYQDSFDSLNYLFEYVPMPASTEAEDVRILAIA